MVVGLNGYLDFNGGGWVEWVFGWVAAGDKFQLRIHIEFFKSYVGASGLDLGYHMSGCCGSLHCLC